MINIAMSDLFKRVGTCHAFRHPEAKADYVDAMIGFLTATDVQPEVGSKTAELLADQRAATMQWMSAVEATEGGAELLAQVGDWFAHAIEWGAEYEKGQASGDAAMRATLDYYAELDARNPEIILELEQAINGLIFMYQSAFDQFRARTGERHVDHSAVKYTPSHKMYNVLVNFKCHLFDIRSKRTGESVPTDLQDFASAVGNGRVTNSTVTTPHPNQVQTVPVRMIMRLIELCDQVGHMPRESDEKNKLAYANLDAVIRTVLRTLHAYNVVIESEYGKSDEKVAALIKVVENAQASLHDACDKKLLTLMDDKMKSACVSIKALLVGQLIDQDFVSPYKMTVQTEWVIHRDYARFDTRAVARASGGFVEKLVNVLYATDAGYRGVDSAESGRDKVIEALDAEGYFAAQATRSWEGTDVDGKPANDDVTVAMNVYGSRMEMLRSLMDDWIERFDPASLKRLNGQRGDMMKMVMILFNTWQQARVQQETYLRKDPKKSAMLELNQRESVELKRRILQQLVNCYDEGLPADTVVAIQAVLRTEDDAAFETAFDGMVKGFSGEGLPPEFASVVAAYGRVAYDSGQELLGAFNGLRKKLLDISKALTPKQVELLNMWQMHLTINKNMRLSRSQYRQEGAMQRWSKELVVQVVGQTSAAVLDGSELEGKVDLDARWATLQTWGAKDSPVATLRYHVLSIFERVANPEAKSGDQQISIEEVVALQGLFDAAMKSDLCDEAMREALGVLSPQLALLSAEGAQTIEQLGAIWNGVNAAVFSKQGQDVRQFIQGVLALDADAVPSRDRFVRYAAMMANQSLGPVLDALQDGTGGEGSLLAAVKSHQPPIDAVIIAKLERRLATNNEVRAHQVLMDEIRNSVAPGSDLALLIDEYNAIYNVVVDCRPVEGDAAFDPEKVDDLPLPAQVKRNLNSMAIIAREPEAFDALLISLFRDYRDISSLRYLAHVYGMPERLLDVVPLFEDPDVLNPRAFVGHMNEIAAALGSYPDRVMNARSDGQRQGGRLSEMSSMAVLMQVMSKLGIKIENGGGPVKERGGTAHDNWSHMDLDAVVNAFIGTIQGDDRAKSFNTMDRATHSALIDQVAHLRVALQHALNEAERPKEASRASVEDVRLKLATYDALDGPSEWQPDFLEGDQDAQAIHDIFVKSWEPMFEEVVSNPRWNAFVKTQTTHGIKFPTSSRTPDRPTLGQKPVEESIILKWRAITCNWNVTVPGFNYYLFAAKYVLPQLKEYAKEHLGGEDKWVEVVSRMMDNSPFIRYMWQSIGSYLQHNASPQGTKAFASIGDLGSQMHDLFSESHKSAMEMASTLHVYQLKKRESVEEDRAAVQVYNQTVSVSKCQPFPAVPLLVFSGSAQEDKDTQFLVFRYLTAHLLGGYRKIEADETMDATRKKAVLSQLQRRIVPAMVLFRSAQVASQGAEAAT